MNRKIVFAAAAAVALVSVIWAASAGYSLKRAVKVGDEAEFKFGANINVMGMDIEINGKSKSKVTKVEEKTYEIETTQYDVKVTTPQGEQTQDEPDKTTSTVNFDGTTVKNDSEETDAESTAFSATLDTLTTVKAPDHDVNIGDKWTAEIKAPAKSLPPIKAEYELLGEEKVGSWDCIKVGVSSALAGDPKTSGKGTVWLDKATFMQIREEFKLTDVVLPGMGGEKVAMSLNSIRTK